MALKLVNIPDLVCKTHPKYKAIRKPTGKCKECRAIYRLKHGIRPHGNEKFKCFLTGTERTYGAWRKAGREAAQHLIKAFESNDPNAQV